MDECGFVSVTGGWDGFSGWGAHTDTDMKADIAPGDYEFVILCVDITVTEWWNDIWGASTVLRPGAECAANAEGEPNYGLTVGPAAETVAYCAGGCGAICTSSIPTEPALELVGIMDLSLSGSDGKAIHVRATADIADLSIYGLGIANNGGGTDGVEFTFPTAAAAAGDNILVARSASAMESYLGTCYGTYSAVFIDDGSTNPNGSSAGVSQNGDDAIELFMTDGSAWNQVELFGELDVDGTGQSWEYLDSWAYKADGAWTYGGVNCTDGSSTTAESTCIYPACGG